MPIRRRKRKDGKVVFDVRAEYGGVRVERTVPTTITEARRVESKMLQDLIHGRYEIFKNRKNPTFRKHAEDYKGAVTWQRSYRRTLISIGHLVKFFGSKRLTEIQEQDFIDYRTMRLQTVGVATLNRELACLKRMLNLAVRNNEYFLSKSPLDQIRFIKEPPAENRVLTVDEYQKLLEVAPEYFRRIVFFACHTGMRLMEMLNLTFGQIRVWLGGMEIELTETKSGEKEYVPLGAEVGEMLETIAKERRIDLHNVADQDRGKFVLTGMRGQRLKSVRKPMAKTFRAAGIQQRPFHTFRHFWTKAMFEAGNDPATIQKVGRWRDFKTMLRYCYTTRPQEHEAVNKLAQHLGKKTAKILALRGYGGENKKDVQK